MGSGANEYMEQVQAEQSAAAANLRAGKIRRRVLPAQVAAPEPPSDEPEADKASADLFSGPLSGPDGGAGEGRRASRQRRGTMDVGTGDEVPTVDVKVTGFWRWRSVIVPPNAFVVHTRRGVAEPLHCGLGISFRFNPATDTYLVVPGTIQTILISANCICKERQGIVVQGYVQWAIADFRAAYKTLDFSDPFDPMRVVTTQLKEQAEATIKDAVATMSIDDVLDDKQPIIRELTRRLRETTEAGGDSGGLGLRIVTVQIKEAVVSSASLWETLQRPFRAERAKEARLAELEQQRVVTEREAAIRAEQEARRVDSDGAMERHRRDAEVAAQQHEQTTALQQARQAAEAQRERVALARAAQELEQTEREQQVRHEARLLALEGEREAVIGEHERTRLERELTAAARRHEAELARRQAELKLDRAAQELQNGLSTGALRARLMEHLPQILQSVPMPGHVEHYHSAPDVGVAALLQDVLDAVRGRPAGADDGADAR